MLICNFYPKWVICPSRSPSPSLLHIYIDGSSNPAVFTSHGGIQRFKGIIFQAMQIINLRIIISLVLNSSFSPQSPRPHLSQQHCPAQSVPTSRSVCVLVAPRVVCPACPCWRRRLWRVSVGERWSALVSMSERNDIHIITTLSRPSYPPKSSSSQLPACSFGRRIVYAPRQLWRQLLAARRTRLAFEGSCLMSSRSGVLRSCRWVLRHWFWRRVLLRRGMRRRRGLRLGSSCLRVCRSSCPLCGQDGIGMRSEECYGVAFQTRRGMYRYSEW